LQLDILMGLRRCDSRLTMVGDDAQAIYGFRGASPRFLLDAQDYFAGLVTITLNVNYRSSGAILKVANALGADAPEGFCATLRETSRYSVRALRAWCTAPMNVTNPSRRGPRPRALRGRCRSAEPGGPLSRVTPQRRPRNRTLATTHTLHQVRGLRYLEAAHVKDLLAAFRLADNPRDEMAWFRLLQLMPGVGPARARRAIDALRDGDKSLPLSFEDIQGRWPEALDHVPLDTRDGSTRLIDALTPRAHESP